MLETVSIRGWLERARLQRRRKRHSVNTAFQAVEKLRLERGLKGCGFQPHRKTRKINLGFSRCGYMQRAPRVTSVNGSAALSTPYILSPAQRRGPAPPLPARAGLRSARRWEVLLETGSRGQLRQDSLAN